MLKVDLIIEAYEEIRISGITVDPSPNDLNYSLKKLESMMAELEDSRNICLGYAFEDVPDPNTEISIPRWSRQAVVTNLAMRLVAAFGKEIPASLSMQASQSISTLSGKAMTVNPIQYPTRQPVGSGNYIFNKWQKFYESNPQPPVTCDTKHIVRGEINNFSTSFSSYLQEGELISLYTTEDSQGLTVSNLTLNVDIIEYKVECSDYASDLETITFTITTSDGRVKPFVVNFNVSG